MKNHRLAVIIVLAFLVGPTLLAGAQGGVSLSIDDLQCTDFPKCRVFVTVRDANGIPIPGIEREQLEIVEDGQSSLAPTEVSTQINPQAILSAILTIDVSGSMKGKAIEESKRAANAFLDRLSDQDRVGLIAFADQVDLDPNKLAEGKEVSVTTDKNAVRNVINFLDTKIGWDTPLYDAIYKAIEWAAKEPVGRRAVIVLTDGRDERDNKQGTPVPDKGSLMKPDDPINEAAKLSIPVFAIGLGSRIDQTYLSRLALRTGGTYRQAPKAEDATQLFQDVVDKLKQQYVLTYNSTLKQDGNSHSLMVRVQLPAGQSFDETKFQFAAEPLPAEPVMLASMQAPQSVAEATPAPTETEPTTDSGGIIDTIRDTIADKPGLALGIGAGLLLLIGLIVALIVVLHRGRKGSEQPPAAVELPEAYAPSPEWSPVATGPATPAPVSIDQARTEAPPPDWAGGPAVPFFAQPTPGMPMGPADAAAGGTRVAERAPKHLALLVDKRRPDRKYDLKGTMNVGRSADNQIVIEDPTISRHHAWIKEQEDDFLVFDIGSANGTFVNDEKVEGPHPLQNGDVVRFGQVAFVFSKVF